jgi:hypothetical protein
MTTLFDYRLAVGLMAKVRELRELRSRVIRVVLGSISTSSKYQQIFNN